MTREDGPKRRSSGEPERLRRGKEFHRRVQAEWKAEAEGVVTPEKHIRKRNGRAGRIDVHVGGDNDVAILEIKASDWDAMSPSAVRRNVKRQIRQVWSYIESEMEGDVSISPGISFPARPKTPGRLELIERLFYDQGIVAVWEDESIEETRARAKRSAVRD